VTAARVLGYYAQHSPITAPGPCAEMLDGLPATLADLVAVVNGLIIHPVAVARYGLSPSPETDGEHLRSVADMLGRIGELDRAPLTVAREPARRLRANCRGSAVLLIALLRQQGVPARKRTGFARYIDFIHEIAECWDAAQQRWVLVDPDVPLTVQRAWLAEHGQPSEQAGHWELDLRAGDAYVTGADAWQRCRQRRADPHEFHGAGRGAGWPGVRQALLQDLDGLNKVELLTYELWGGEIDEKPFEELTADDLALLDEAAERIGAVYMGCDDLRSFYTASPHGRSVTARLGEVAATSS
jgi:hypothetical protein